MLELGEDAPARAESTCDHQDFAPKELPGIPAGAVYRFCSYGALRPACQTRTISINTPAKIRLQDQTRSALNQDFRRMASPTIS